MSDSMQGFEKIITQDIVICPNCKGSGYLKAVYTDGSVKLRMGKPITEICAVCRGDGKVGHIVREQFFPMPGTVAPPEPTGIRKLLNKLK